MLAIYQRNLSKVVPAYFFLSASDIFQTTNAAMDDVEAEGSPRL